MAQASARYRVEILVLTHLGHSEEAEEWVTFLSLLEAQGIRGENGLKLIIHDGGSGLCSALRTVYFGAAEQRCLFHKLRNLYRAIHVSDNLSPKQRRRRRKAIFKDFHAIWQARRYDTVLRRYLKVVRAYRDSQPEAVATLRRDFRSTITYYRVEQQFPAWDRKHLRTTSRLERFNRRIQCFPGFRRLALVLFGFGRFLLGAFRQFLRLLYRGSLLFLSQQRATDQHQHREQSAKQRGPVR